MTPNGGSATGSICNFAAQKEKLTFNSSWPMTICFI